MLCGALRLLQPALRWVPFVTHMQLLAVLWLQLPIFRSATRVLALLVRTMRALRPRARPAAADEQQPTSARAPRANALYSSRLSQRPARAAASPRASASSATAATGQTG